jgi:tRNA threonylcarbamoyladenosine biosynthesis protein TsaE
MARRDLSLSLPDPEATAALGRRLGAGMCPGDSILLHGGLGAGKTHFARALIQSRLARPEDVPSPTYTLVQVYETPGADIWHADLYRISGPDEAAELGLDEAFETAICLIEWPDRLGDWRPPGAIDLTLVPERDGAARRADLSWRDPRWDARLGVCA